MKWQTFFALAVSALLLAPAAQAQSLVATYYNCGTANEDEADFIMNTVFAPLLQSHVDAGDISSWGWIEHQAGGSWRRILTLGAPDQSTLVTQWGVITGEMEEEHPNATHRFNEICGTHDDYIWELTSTSEGVDPNATPDAWISTYFVCNEATEARADELMAAMAPAYDPHIAAGHIAGWSWYTHVVGGQFRRLLTVSGSNAVSVLEGRGLVIADLTANYGDELAEFSSICSSHVDYLWGNAAASDED